MSDLARPLTDLGKAGAVGSFCDACRLGGDAEGVTEAERVVRGEARCTGFTKDRTVLQSWGCAGGWGLGARAGKPRQSGDLDSRRRELRLRSSWPTGSMAPPARSWARRVQRGRDVGCDPRGGCDPHAPAGASRPLRQAPRGCGFSLWAVGERSVHSLT